MEVGDDTLTYCPQLTDIGDTCSFVYSTVGEAVANLVRSSAKLNAINYLEMAKTIDNSIAFKGQASAVSSLKAKLTNSNMSAPFEPIITAMACNFKKIELDLPVEATSSTIVGVISAALLGSHVYTRRTISLIHNMMVEVVYPSCPVAAGRNLRPVQPTYAITKVRHAVDNYQLLPLPRPKRLDSLEYKSYVLFARLLCHFHGVVVPANWGPADQPGSNPSHSYPAAYCSQLWDQMNRATPAEAISHPSDADGAGPALFNYFDQYFSNWGRIPSTDSGEIHDCISRPFVFPGKGISEPLEPYILASTYDMYYPPAGIGGTVVSANTPRWRRLDLADADDDRVPEHINKQEEASNVDRIYVNHSFHTENDEGEYADGVTKVRPRHRALFGFHDSDSANPMITSNRDAVMDFMSHMRKFASTDFFKESGIPDNKFISPLLFNLLSDRLVDLYGYCSRLATITTLTDHSPAGYSPMCYPSGVHIDHQSPLYHREYSRACGPITYGRVATDAASTTPGYQFFRDPVTVEPQHHVDIINLEWLSVTAFQLLGVAPSQAPDLTHSLDMFKQSVSFNHDMTVLKVAARIFQSFYLAPNPAGGYLHPVGASSNPKKAELVVDIYRDLCSLFPSVSPLTSTVISATKNCDIGMNQVWKKGVFVDAQNTGVLYTNSQLGIWRPNASSQSFLELGDDRLPFLSYKPFSPLRNSTRTYPEQAVVYPSSAGQRNTGVNAPLTSLVKYPGFESHMYYTLANIATTYCNHPLSFQDHVSKVAVSYTGDVATSSEFRSRRGAGGNMVLPSLRGDRYLPDSYHEAPYTECSHSRLRPALPTFDVQRLMSTGQNAKFLDHYYSQFKAGVGAGTLTSHVIKYPYSLSFKKASGISDREAKPHMPTMSSGYMSKESVTSMLYSPDLFIGNPEAVLDLINTPTTTIPLLKRNVGPYIPASVPRDVAWPANADFTDPDSLAENVRFNLAGAPMGSQSMQYNTNVLGVLISLKYPVSVKDPKEYVKYSVNPLFDNEIV